MDDIKKCVESCCEKVPRGGVRNEEDDHRHVSNKVDRESRSIIRIGES